MISPTIPPSFWSGTRKPSTTERRPSDKTSNLCAGQPWLALRAAMLARLPEAPTLDMLSFLAPQEGDQGEQPRFFCDKQLVPALRNWFTLAARKRSGTVAPRLCLSPMRSPIDSLTARNLSIRMTTFPPKWTSC